MLLAGIFLRLDRSDNYDQLVGKVKGLAEHAWPVCAELVGQIGEKDRVRVDILRAARGLLQERATRARRIGNGRRWCRVCILYWASSVWGTEIRPCIGMCGRRARIRVMCYGGSRREVVRCLKLIGRFLHYCS